MAIVRAPADLDVVAQNILSDLHGSKPMSRSATLEWRNYRVTAGMAFYDRWAIALSTVVLTTEEQLRDTLIHEYAHLLAVDRHGAKAAGHGREWQQAMVDLGATPQVRHRYEVQRNRSHKQVVYRCLVCGTLLVRSRRLPRRRVYLHSRCGGPIRFVKVQTTSDSAIP